MTVYLVGAGPGDPGLLTARALELIAAADVIVYDRLIPASALDGARPDAELIYAGKEGGGPSIAQDEIERLMVEHGAAGREVVRLKGGDPFVFGRGGEEAEALRAGGDRLRGGPGGHRGVAAPAYAGIPVTHRDAASAVAFVTGHEDPAKSESALGWSALAAFPGRWSSTWVSASCRRSSRGCSRAAARRTSRRRWSSAGRCPISGRSAGRSRRSPTWRPRRRSARRRSRCSATSRRSRRSAGLACARPAGGPHGGGHPRACAGERAGGDASWARRHRRRGAGDPDARSAGPAPELDGFDLVCVTSPNGVGALFERLAAAGLDAGRLPGAGGGHRPGHRAGACWSAGSSRRRARAVRRRGAGRGVGGRARFASAHRPRIPGARRAARCAARPRCGGRGAAAVRDGRRAGARFGAPRSLKPTT